MTISCGGTTGVFMTQKNKHEMTAVCRQKYEYYETMWTNREPNGENLLSDAKWDNGNLSTGVDAMRKSNDAVVGINELVVRVNHFDKLFKWVVPLCVCVRSVVAVVDGCAI